MAEGEIIFLSTLPFALLYLLITVIPLYLTLYCVGIKAPAPLTFLSTTITVFALYLCPYLATTQCLQTDMVLRLICGTAIMKVLDMYFRRGHPPVIKFPASPAVYAFYLLVELRYESFDISTARHRKYPISDTREFFIHLTIFCFLQLLPQTSIIKAFGVLFTIWLIWNTMNFLLKYPNSQPLFGPIYRAPSLSSFWTDTWHNAYTSPIRTLGYRPMRKLFGPAGGVVGGFAVMAVFHVWALAPYVSAEGLVRVAVFFMVNAVGCIVDYWIWGTRDGWVRGLVSWGFEIFWAQWTVQKCDIPDGLFAINFKNICRVK